MHGVNSYRDHHCLLILFLHPAKMLWVQQRKTDMVNDFLGYHAEIGPRHHLSRQTERPDRGNEYMLTR